MTVEPTSTEPLNFASQEDLEEEEGEENSSLTASQVLGRRYVEALKGEFFRVSSFNETTFSLAMRVQDLGSELYKCKNLFSIMAHLGLDLSSRLQQKVITHQYCSDTDQYVNAAKVVVASWELRKDRFREVSNISLNCILCFRDFRPTKKNIYIDADRRQELSLFSKDSDLYFRIMETALIEDVSIYAKDVNLQMLNMVSLLEQLLNPEETGGVTPNSFLSGDFENVLSCSEGKGFSFSPPPVFNDGPSLPIRCSYFQIEETVKFMDQFLISLRGVVGRIQDFKTLIRGEFFTSEEVCSWEEDSLELRLFSKSVVQDAILNGDVSVEVVRELSEKILFCTEVLRGFEKIQSLDNYMFFQMKSRWESVLNANGSEEESVITFCRNPEDLCFIKLPNLNRCLGREAVGKSYELSIISFIDLGRDVISYQLKVITDVLEKPFLQISQDRLLRALSNEKFGKWLSIFQQQDVRRFFNISVKNAQEGWGVSVEDGSSSDSQGSEILRGCPIPFFYNEDKGINYFLEQSEDFLEKMKRVVSLCKSSRVYFNEMTGVNGNLLTYFTGSEELFNLFLDMSEARREEFVGFMKKRLPRGYSSQREKEELLQKKRYVVLNLQKLEVLRGYSEGKIPLEELQGLFDLEEAFFDQRRFAPRLEAIAADTARCNPQGTSRGGRRDERQRVGSVRERRRREQSVDSRVSSVAPTGRVWSNSRGQRRSSSRRDLPNKRTSLRGNGRRKQPSKNAAIKFFSDMFSWIVKFFTCRFCSSG